MNQPLSHPVVTDAMAMPSAVGAAVPDSHTRTDARTSEADGIPADSSIALARVCADGRLLSASNAFYRVLGVDTAGGNTPLTDAIALRFSASEAAVRTRLSANEASVLVLDPGSDGVPVRLRLDALHAGQRLVLLDSERESDEMRQARLEQSHLDPLTGLGNRRLLAESIDRWQREAGVDSTLAAIMLDLDRFKQVNDTLGHGAGDTLLKLVAQRIKRVARSSDTLVRLGGDEFLILHGSGEQPIGADRLAARLVDLLGRPFLVDGQQINIGTSIGIAFHKPADDKLDDLLRHADLALYDAKQAGRNCFRCFDPSLALRALERRDLELQLRRALHLREFELVYQPQTDLTSGQLSGFEALIRWNSPVRGLVSPADFIPLAEEIGEIIPIGEWVLRTACEQASHWSPHLCVAVNVSPVQFGSTRFLASVQEALDASGLAPERLEVEITEGMLFDDTEQATNQLWALHSMGVQIAMDDFGTGYSSLSHLNSFPFSKIKIDQSFVRGEQTEKSRALVKAIISLGDSLGMKTLAEGVETIDQYALLTRGGCLEAQGYLISKPMHVDSIGDYIAAYRVPATETPTTDE